MNRSTGKGIEEEEVKSHLMRTRMYAPKAVKIRGGMYEYNPNRSIPSVHYPSGDSANTKALEQSKGLSFCTALGLIFLHDGRFLLNTSEEVNVGIALSRTRKHHAMRMEGSS